MLSFVRIINLVRRVLSALFAAGLPREIYFSPTFLGFILHNPVLTSATFSLKKTDDGSDQRSSGETNGNDLGMTQERLNHGE